MANGLDWQYDGHRVEFLAVSVSMFSLLVPPSPVPPMSYQNKRSVGKPVCRFSLLKEFLGLLEEDRVVF